MLRAKEAAARAHGWEPYEPPMKHASSIRIGFPFCGPALAAAVGVATTTTLPQRGLEHPSHFKVGRPARLFWLNRLDRTGTKAYYM